MWLNVIPVESATMRQFEQEFHFRIQDVFRQYLIEHNGGTPSSGAFPTAKRERALGSLLDFGDKTSANGAWAINRRLNSKLGDKRIIIGKDLKGNFICLERDYKEQFVVVWSHVSGEFERCLLDLPALMRTIG